MFCRSRRPTKQQARRHGRSILQHPAHGPPVAITAGAGNIVRRGYNGPDSLGQEPSTSLQEPTLTRGTSAEHATRPRTHGDQGCAQRHQALPARLRQSFVHRRQPEARKRPQQQGAVGSAAGNPKLTDSSLKHDWIKGRGRDMDQRKWSGPGGLGQPRATARHAPQRTDLDALHLFCSSRRPTKQYALRHGRSILQYPAHGPPVAITGQGRDMDQR